MTDNSHDQNRSRPGIILSVVLGLLILGGAAVALLRLTKEPAPASSAGSPGATRPDEEELDRLRSLGYVDFVPAQKDDSKSGVLLKTEDSYPGYNFFTNAFLCMAVLADEMGAVVNYWHQDELCDRWANAEFLSTGDILVVARNQQRNDTDDLDSRRFLMKLSWTGELLWKLPVPVHHDVEAAPDGKLLLLTTDSRRIPEVHPSMTVRDSRITLLRQDGAEEDSLSLYDVLRAAPELVSIQKVRAKKRNEIDLIHANSVERMNPQKLAVKREHPLYSPTHILFCTRHQDTIGIVDWTSKKLVWAWGQRILSGPHDATLLSNGNILVFDNGLNRGWSRILELDPLRKEVVWMYKAEKKRDFYSPDRGSNQRLPNNNTLISESSKGRAFEVDAGGQIVWEYANLFRNAKGERATIVRFYRIEREVIDNIIRTRGEGRKKPPLQVKTDPVANETY